MTEAFSVRKARRDDYDAVAALTENTWPEREGGDYVTSVFHHWMDTDGPDQRTFVVVADGEVVGLVQAVRLSEYEAWYQAMRVHPDYQGKGVSVALNRACFDWSRGWGATVGRLMVFSWNVAGLGAARANGFDPGTEFRWIHPEPDPDVTPDGRVIEDPDAAYAYWTNSDAREHLGGLALDMDESWACSELTREDLKRAHEETRVFSAIDENGGDARSGTRGMTFRVRDYERETDDGSVHLAEYGVAAWEDVDALRDLLAAVSRDASSLGADEIRILVPETAQHVSDAAYAKAGIADHPDFVLGVDLTGWD